MVHPSCLAKTLTRLVCAVLVACVGRAFADGREDAALRELGAAFGPEARITRDDATGAVKFVSGRMAGARGSTGEALARSLLRLHGGAFGIQDPDAELSLSRSFASPYGHFFTFQQRRGGLDVVGAEVTIRVQAGSIRTVANHFRPGILASAVPVLSEKEAVSLAQAAAGSAAAPDATELVFLPWEEEVQLAYRVTFPFESGPPPTRNRVGVDARTGDVIFIENRVMNDGPTVGSGFGVDGAWKTFDTYELGGVFYLGNLPIETEKVKVKTYSAKNTKILPGFIMKDSDDVWTDPAAVDAHTYINFTLDYYKNNFTDVSWYPRSGFARSGGFISTVHYDVGYDNAFWDGSQMVFGDGKTTFDPLSGALDVVAHELTHGVTEAVNALAYCKEPGALNESWSDVMAMFATIEYGEALPYQMGEKIMKIARTPGYEAYYALRRLDDPPFRTDAYPVNDYDPADPLGSWGQPEHTSEQYRAGCWPWTDNGGVHINSGIPNKAAYSITQTLGPAKTQQIYYLAMFYLSSNAQFVDGRDAVEQAAVDLYGTGAELAAVQSAFTAVGIP